MATYVILFKTMFVVDCKKFDDIKEAEKEYKRQARNAWRRKRAYCQVEFHQPGGDDLKRLRWFEDQISYNLIWSMVPPPDAGTHE